MGDAEEVSGMFHVKEWRLKEIPRASLGNDKKIRQLAPSLFSFEPHVFVRMMIENCGIPALHAWLDEKGVRVKINRNDRCIIEEN